MAGVNLEDMTVAELLELHGQTLAELRRREVARTTNASAGDFEEWLVGEATGGKPADDAQKSWDVLAPESRLKVDAAPASTHWTTERRDGPMPNGGAYSIVVIDDTGRIREITEYTADGNIVTREVRRGS